MDGNEWMASGACHATGCSKGSRRGMAGRDQKVPPRPATRTATQQRRCACLSQPRPTRRASSPPLSRVSDVLEDAETCIERPRDVLFMYLCSCRRSWHSQSFGKWPRGSSLTCCLALSNSSSFHHLPSRRTMRFRTRIANVGLMHSRTITLSLC